jgi:ankyrin repeat protein
MLAVRREPPVRGKGRAHLSLQESMAAVSPFGLATRTAGVREEFIVSTVPLPDEPSFEQLRIQAKELHRAVRAGDATALAEVAERYPDAGPPISFRLSTAQAVVARRYGFSSWARLRRHVEVVARYSRFPDRLAAGESGDRAEQFLRLASLSYEDVGPSQWDEARQLLADHPEIVDGNVYVAAAVCDTVALRRLLEADPTAARREGGPYRWEPLVYLAYARHDPGLAEDAALGAARLLLAAGADPNAGYLWHGLTSPFTALTGVFGEGEGGPVLQPRHPSQALGRLLLAAGADPNDAQTLYNRMFEPDNDHLVLLFEFGLGTGDGGPWRRRLGEARPSPTRLVRDQLAWAITHGMTERVQLLADHGADVVTPFETGSTPAALAATTGHPALVDYLVGRGAPRPTLLPKDAFVAAVLAVDRSAVQQLAGDHPGLVEAVRARRPGLMAWAAASSGAAAAELLVDLGFDVNAKGRTDRPSKQPWQTALHKAVEDANIDLARTLLRLGADPDIKDMRFDSTPLGWARHFDRPELIDLLEPLTTPDPPDAG